MSNTILLLEAAVTLRLAPSRLYLSQSPVERDVALLPTLLRLLNEFAHYLQETVRGQVPHNLYRNHLQATIALQDQLVAHQQNLTELRDGPTSTPFVRKANGKAEVEVTLEQLLFFSHIGLKDLSIANLLGVSRRTVTRRRKEHGLGKRNLKHSYPPDELSRVS
jgi:DNA-binding NtrC family response regulator